VIGELSCDTAVCTTGPSRSAPKSKLGGLIMELTSPEVYRIFDDILVGWSVGRLEQAIEVLEETERGA
jgi:hypothetical protein